MAPPAGEWESRLRALYQSAQIELQRQDMKIVSLERFQQSADRDQFERELRDREIEAGRDAATRGAAHELGRLRRRAEELLRARRDDTQLKDLQAKVDKLQSKLETSRAEIEHLREKINLDASAAAQANVRERELGRALESARYETKRVKARLAEEIDKLRRLHSMNREHPSVANKNKRKSSLIESKLVSAKRKPMDHVFSSFPRATSTRAGPPRPRLAGLDEVYHAMSPSEASIDRDDEDQREFDFV